MLIDLINKNPEVARQLINEIFKNPDSFTASELAYLLGQTPLPEVQEMVADYLPTVSNDQKLALFVITSEWENPSDEIVKEALNTLRSSDANDELLFWASQSYHVGEDTPYEEKLVALQTITDVLSKHSEHNLTSSLILDVGRLASDYTDLAIPIKELNNEVLNVQSASIQALGESKVQSEDAKKALLGARLT